MDIMMVQQKRAELEAHMLDRLKAFELETNTRIEDIHVHRQPGGGGTHTDRPLQAVYVDVEIGRAHTE